MTQSESAPQQFRCIECNRYFDRADIIWSHKAERFDKGTCVCEECIPAWKEKINPPAFEEAHDTEKHESFISHYIHHFHDRKIHQREKMLAQIDDDFAAFVHAVNEDPPLASILMAMAGLKAEARGKLIDTIIGQLDHKKPPKELLLVLESLKKDDIAAKVVEVLGKGEV